MSDLSKAIKRGKKGLKKVGRKIGQVGKKIEDEAEKIVKSHNKRALRDTKNFIRWVVEDDCDRIGRKEGPEAKRKCEEKRKGNEEGRGGVRPPVPPYYAAKEVDCWKPGEAGRFGTTTVRELSNESVAAAENAVDAVVKKGGVCAASWNIPDLQDRKSRWVHK